MANTYPDVIFEKQEQAGTGSSADVIALCTADKDTTACINKRGLSHGTVFNESAGIVVVTYYAARIVNGTRIPHTNQDAGAATQTIAAGGSQELPASVAGVPHLLPVVGTAVTLYFHFER